MLGRPTTLAQAWDLWLAYRATGPRPLRRSTRADYESIWRKHLAPALGDVSLIDLDGLTIAGFIVATSSQGVQPKRLSNILVPLRACLRWHHRLGSFARDPTPWFEAAAPAAKERKVLSIGQIEALIQAMPEAYRAFVAFSAYVGTRAGETRALTWDDVDLSAQAARIDKTYYRSHLQKGTKTGPGRIVPLPPHIAELLAQWRERCPASENDLVFPSPSGRPLDLDVFRRRVFRPAVRRAGLPEDLRIHDLRHASASLHLQHGATVREVMEIHGWSQIQTALRYLHTIDSLHASAERLSQARAAAEGRR